MPASDLSPQATTARAAALVEELRALGSEAHRAGMARFAINIHRACGVPVPVLRALARRIGRDHALAQALWATGQHEARLLACFVDDPAAVTDAQAEAWIGDLDSWDLCDQATTSLFDRSPLAWTKAVQWTQREDLWGRRAAFSTMAGLAVHDKRAGDRAFIDLLPYIEQAATDDRNFVRKAVNWALRNIGKRNDALNAAALACARRIQAAADARAGGPRGGDASDRSARWIARDAIRELERVARRGEAPARR